MIANLASVAVLGVAALSGVARAQDGDCQTAIEAIAEVVGPNFAQLLGRVSAEQGAQLLGTVAAADNVLDEPVTLFIPTDKAFGDANAADLSDAELFTVLATHAVPGNISSDQLKQGVTAASVGGAEIMGVDEGDFGSVKVVGSAGPTGMVVDNDVPACSGPIHVIDTVLLPASIAGEAATEAPAPAPMEDAPTEAPVPADAIMDMAPGPADGTRDLPPGALGGTTGDAEPPATGPEVPCMNVVDALSQNPDTAVLAQLAAAYLDPTVINLLTDPMSNLTVFAPPEADLLALLGGVQSEQVPPETAQTILLAHVVPDFLQAEDLLMMDEAMLPTAAGDDVILDVSVQGSAITLTANNSVQVIMGDLDGCSETAVIHQISEVIVPEGVDIDLASYPTGDPEQLAAAIPPGSAAPGTRGGIGGAPPPTEAGADSAAGVFRGLLSVGAAAVALAVAL